MRCADLGIAQAEVARRLLFLWLLGEVELPTGVNYRALVDMLVEWEVGSDD